MATETLTQKRWTYQDYALLDDGKRYEILDGDLLEMSAPTTYHQDCLRDLGFLMWQFVKEKKSGKIFLAPTDVIFDEDHTTQPDILFVSTERAALIRKEGIFGAPDVVVEILSPSPVYHDRHKKRQVYERFGVVEYWLVDAANRTIEVMELTELQGGGSRGYTLFSFGGAGETVRSKRLAGFEVKVSDVIAAPDLLPS